MGDYSSGDEASLPGTSANLDHVYDATDLSNVGTNDTNYVNQTGSAGYELHQYKDSITAGNATVTWIGKSSLAPSSSKVQLQVYKVAVPAGWQDVSGVGASNNVAAADTDFTLSGTIATADYLDTGVTTFRIYQAAGGASANFGYETVGDNPNSTDFNTVFWQNATPASNGNLTSISFYTYRDFVGQKLGVAIYDDNSGAPGNRLAFVAAADGVEITSDSYGWVQVPLTYNGLVASTKYWLAAAVTGVDVVRIRWEYNTGVGNNAYYLDNGGAFPVTGAGASASTVNISMFGTYTET